MAVEAIRNGSPPVFLFRQKLKDFDVKEGQDRLYLTKSTSTPIDTFLNQAEVEEAAVNGEFKILGVDQQGNPYYLVLKKWASLKMLVINGWSNLVAANNAKEGDSVEIWGFRYDQGKPALAVAFKN